MEADHLRLDAGRRDALLHRLGFDKLPDTDLNGLTRLYRSWLQTIPFCGSRKRRYYGADTERPGPLPVMTAQDFVDAFLAEGTGGTCFPTAEALYQMLRSCGFEARRAIGSMLDFPQIPGPNHGTVVVAIDGCDYLVDPFFGSIDPLPLDGSAREAGPSHVSIRLELADGVGEMPVILWRFHTGREWFRFGFDPRYPEVSHALFTERYEKSGGSNSVFNSHLYISRHDDGEVLTIFRGSFYRLKRDGTIDKRSIEMAERDGILVDRFGLAEAMVATIPPDHS